MAKRASLSDYTDTYTYDTVPKVWRDVLVRIPDYDCFFGAEEYVFDAGEALDKISFFAECIQHVEGAMAGKPYVLVPHEEAICAALFGWKRKDGTRRYREALYFVPRKNSKSTFCAGLAVVVVFTDKESAMQCYSTAADREQAALVYEIARKMVEAEPELSARCLIYKANKSIQTHTNDFYRAISAEASTKHGYNVHLAINDELHAHKKADLIEVMRTGMGARTQPLMIHITTSDYDRPSICNQTYDFAKLVQKDPRTDLAFLPIIYEIAQERADALVYDGAGQMVPYWTTPDAAREANPMYDHIPTMPDFLAREVKRALAEPSYENEVKRLHFNIRTQQAHRWLPMHVWDTMDPADAIVWRADMLEKLKGRKCWAGLDLGSTSDLLALVLQFDYEDGAGYISIPFLWVPRDTVRQRTDTDKAPYDVWVKQGFILETPGNVTDYDCVRRDINDLAKRYHIQRLNVDSAFQGMQLSVQLGDTDGLPVHNFRQNIIDYAAPTRRFEELVMSRNLHHGGNPVYHWQASHVAVVEAEGGLLKPSKKHSTEKIDIIAAAVMALGGRMADGENKRSVYDDRGVFLI